MIKSIFLTIAPGILAGQIYIKLTKKKLDIFSHVFIYTFYAYCIYLIIDLLFILRGHGSDTLDLAQANAIITGKYILVSVALVVILPFFTIVLLPWITKIAEKYIKKTPQ